MARREVQCAFALAALQVARGIEKGLAAVGCQAHHRDDGVRLPHVQVMARGMVFGPVLFVLGLADRRPGERFALGGDAGDDDQLDQFALHVIGFEPALGGDLVDAQRRSACVGDPAGRPPGVLRIRYRAGIDLAAYPSVRTWLLIQAATAHEFREALITGTLLQQLPPTFLDAQLAEVTVPPRF